MSVSYVVKKYLYGIEAGKQVVLQLGKVGLG